MRGDDIRVLFDFNYWANRQIVASCAGISTEAFTASPSCTYRNLRGTLVHTLDVELSWRRRLRGEPRDVWDQSLVDADYPSVSVLSEHWTRDEAEMRAWLQTLADDELAAIVDLGNADRFPLWYYLVHVVTHSAEQRRDAALLLENSGQSAPDLEFLYYADSLTA